jgi:hypothetical protein
MSKGGHDIFAWGDQLSRGDISKNNKKYMNKNIRCNILIVG